MFEYKKLSPEEMKSRGILGRLVGVCADFLNPTRNGRLYKEDLWDKVFASEIMQEKINNRVVYGELAHPADREEIDPEKIAVCLAEVPKKGKDGKLYAVFDILDTPNGRILKTMCDYGSTVGISSRGTGDITTENGEEIVDPDTYTCECFDVVLVPAVKEARLQYVTESYKPGLKKKLAEAFNAADSSGKGIMRQTLNELGVDIDEGVLSGDDYRYDGWSTGDISLHKDTDWGARDYKDLPVDDDSFDSEAILYTKNGPEKKTTKFIKYLRANSIFPPYYAPAVCPFEKGLGPMYDGHKHGVYDIHDRYEDQETYNLLSDSLHEAKKKKKQKGVVFPTFVPDKDPEGKPINNQPTQVEGPAHEIGGGEAAMGESLSLGDAQKFFNENGYTMTKEVYDKLMAMLDGKKLFTESDEESGENKPDAESNKSDEAEEKPETNEVDNVESEEAVITAEFQEALSKIRRISKDNLDLNEKLSVCTAKEMKLEEQLAKYRQAVARLSDKANEAKDLSLEVSDLRECLEKANQRIKTVESKSKAKLESLSANLEEANSKIGYYQESYERSSKELAESKAVQKKLEKKLTESTSAAEKSAKLVDEYKSSYRALKEKYLNVKSEASGLRTEDVRASLNESYKISDIDNACTKLTQMRGNLNKLPFRITEGMRVEVTPEKNNIINSREFVNSDDDVSDTLLRVIQ